MWRDHLAFAPALTIADRSALAKQDSCQPTTATIHATWTNGVVHDMQKDTAHNTQQQVC